MKLVATHDGEQISVEIEREGNVYRVVIGERVLTVDFAKANAFLRTLRFEDGRQFLIAPHRLENHYEVSFGDRTVHLEMEDPLALRSRRADADLAGSGNLTALMPGRVVKVMATTGQEVLRGTPLLILEAMKMQNEIQSPRDGVVTEIFVSDGQTVDSGAPLMTIG